MDWSPNPPELRRQHYFRCWLGRFSSEEASPSLGTFIKGVKRETYTQGRCCESTQRAPWVEGSTYLSPKTRDSQGMVPPVFRRGESASTTIQIYVQPSGDTLRFRSLHPHHLWPVFKEALGKEGVRSGACIRSQLAYAKCLSSPNCRTLSTVKHWLAR